MIRNNYTLKQLLPKLFALLLGLLFCSLLQSQTNLTAADTIFPSGKIVRWTVPWDVTKLTITAKGARGGESASYLREYGITAGKGASIKGDFLVLPGNVLKVLVGQLPEWADDAGGGGSFITDTLNNPLVIAGGGGANGSINSGTKDGQAGTSGGAGAGTGAGGGGTAGSGGGTTNTAGGGGGLLTDGAGRAPGRAFVNGGGSGFVPGYIQKGGFGGGGLFRGGGGGYSGGGSGGTGFDFVNERQLFGAGGGGGSYNSGTAQENLGGANSGNGYVILNYICPNIDAIHNPDTDGDGVGNICDKDDDGDGDPDVSDCVPLDPSFHRNVPEIVNDGIDQNCDGFDLKMWYQDADGDGFGNKAVRQLANQPQGYVTDSSDCNDSDRSAYPGAAEKPNDGIDQDCDGFDFITWYRDADGDGFGNPALYVIAEGSVAGHVRVGTDCNDADRSVNPGADDQPDDGIDQDCDGFDAKTWYRDADGDGFGTTTDKILANTQPAGYVGDRADCDDTKVLYQDADGDGYGSNTKVP